LDLVLDLDVVLDLFDAGISELTILRNKNWSKTTSKTTSRSKTKSRFLAALYLDKLELLPRRTFYRGDFLEEGSGRQVEFDFANVSERLNHVALQFCHELFFRYPDSLP